MKSRKKISFKKIREDLLLDFDTEISLRSVVFTEEKQEKSDIFAVLPNEELNVSNTENDIRIESISNKLNDERGILKNHILNTINLKYDANNYSPSSSNNVFVTEDIPIYTDHNNHAPVKIYDLTIEKITEDITPSVVVTENDNDQWVSVPSDDIEFLKYSQSGEHQNSIQFKFGKSLRTTQYIQDVVTTTRTDHHYNTRTDHHYNTSAHNHHCDIHGGWGSRHNRNPRVDTHSTRSNTHHSTRGNDHFLTLASEQTILDQVEYIDNGTDKIIIKKIKYLDF